MTSETASVDEDTAPAESNRLGQGQSYLIGDTIYLRGAELRNPRSQAAVASTGTATPAASPGPGTDPTASRTRGCSTCSRPSGEQHGTG